MTTPTAYAYTLTLPYGLWENWGWFESRGYLPEMPGEPLDDEMHCNGDPDRKPMALGLAEHEAWEFNEACEELGGDYGACVADLAVLDEFRSTIV